MKRDGLLKVVKNVILAGSNAGRAMMYINISTGLSTHSGIGEGEQQTTPDPLVRGSGGSGSAPTTARQGTKYKEIQVQSQSQ